MLVKIGQTADHGFDAPLGLLSDCHRRIERFLSALVTLGERRQGGQLTSEDRKVLEAALHYLATAAPRHSADEEDSLFPRLRASSAPEAKAAMEAIERLEGDHRIAEEHHRAADVLGRRWLQDGHLVSRDAAEMLEHLAALERLYRAHIHVEDTELFPAAARVLSESQIQAVGREMAERRGVPYLPPRELTSPEAAER